MNFEFFAPSRIIFGAGKSQLLGVLSHPFGQRVCVVTGSHESRYQHLIEIIQSDHSAVSVFSVSGEPTVEVIQEAARRARLFEPDCVIGIGGGSALDTGKAVSALLTNPGDLIEYLEVIGNGKALIHPTTPYIAVPTTAGTGTEVTQNAVIKSESHQVKVSLRSPHMVPDIVLVDPVLTHSVPPSVTASTGLDTLTQLIEPYVSNHANPMTDSLALKGLECVARSLERAFQNGEDAPAREDMALASLFGGLALANAKLGAVHGIAGPLGGMCPVPHGIACACLLPHVVAENVRTLMQTEHGLGIFARFQTIARILTDRHDAEPEEAVEWIRSITKSLKIPPLSEFGMTESMIPALVENAQHASSMKGNPVKLSDEQISEVIMKSI